MLKNKLRRLVAATALVIATMATSAYAHTENLPSQLSLTTGSTGGLSAFRNAPPMPGPKRPAFLKGTLSSKAAKPSTAKASLTATTLAVLDDGGDLSIGDGAFGAPHCARGDCNCTQGSHGHPNCYTNGRGDCPNHEGLLCIW